MADPYLHAVQLLNHARSLPPDHPRLVGAHTEARHAFRQLADTEREGKGPMIAHHRKVRDAQDRLFAAHTELIDAELRLHGHTAGGGEVHRDQAQHHLTRLEQARDQAFHALLHAEGNLRDHYGWKHA